MCPFCRWPSMRITAEHAIDNLGNQFWHSYCKNCGTEATFVKKPTHPRGKNEGRTHKLGGIKERPQGQIDAEGVCAADCWCKSEGVL